jgi:GNAT superfamily N-acetyltransferase
VARVFVDCWKEGYHGVLPTAYAAGLSYEDQTESWRRVISLPGNVTLVAEAPDGQVIAFLSGGPERSARSRFFAEIYGLYVLPEFRGRRLGRQLLGQFCRELLTIGLRTLTVRVLEANPIRGFYEAMGGREQDTFPVRVVGRSLNEVAYGWSDIRPLADPPIHGNQA